MDTVPASLSDWAFAPVTPESALSTPLTQLLQQRWTLLSLTVVSAAWADQPSATRMDARVRMSFIRVVGCVLLDGIRVFVFNKTPPAASGLHFAFSTPTLQPGKRNFL